MKAAQIDEYGNADVIIVRDVDTPLFKSTQVRIEVFASSLNPFDTTLRMGTMRDKIPLKLPATLGGDIYGKITEIGVDVEQFKIGDMVFGQASVVAGNSGAFAEFCVTSPTQVALAPNLSSKAKAAEIAASPLIGVSAMQAIYDHIMLIPGQKILIHGGGGSIGNLAVQLAKHIGAYVATTATGEQLAKLTSLGVEEVIDYKETQFYDVLKDFDAVFDTVGGQDFEKSLRILKPGGIAVSMIGRVPNDMAAKYSVTAITQSTKVTTEKLSKLRELLELGVLRVVVGATYPLSHITEAILAREAGVVSGKIVIQIKSSD